MDNIVLVGYGGHAKSVADCIERSGEYCIIGYTDSIDKKVRYPYLGTDSDLDEIYKSAQCAVICVGYLGKGHVREGIFEELKRIGYSLPVIIDPSAVVSKSAIVGEGTFIGKGAVVNAEAIIGKACIINTKAIIEHECRVEDFVHISVASVLCGDVTVGRAAFVGANATVIQGKIIEPERIVPAGSTIR